MMSRVFILVGIRITLEMKIKKKSQKRSIKNSIEAPGHDPGASTVIEMIIKHDAGDGKAEQKLNNLAIRDSALPRRSNPDGGEEVVRVHDDVYGGVS